MGIEFIACILISCNVAHVISTIQYSQANHLPGVLQLNGQSQGDVPAADDTDLDGSGSGSSEIEDFDGIIVKNVTYDATWDSLDNRPLPDWYDKNKIGIFIHWGVFSVPGFKTEWFWQNWNAGSKRVLDFMRRNYPPNFTYQEFAPQFTAEFYNPTEWVELFKKAGARYVVLTSKHHEGYTLWPSKYSFSWNSMDVGPHRDLVGELANAVRGTNNLRFGLYHSLYEWFNPLWINDKNNSFTTQDFVNFKTMPELYEIVNTYKPEIIWSDGEWDASDTYWKSKEFIAWLYNASPVKDTVVTNDRWGGDTLCKHGGYYTCKDGYNPGVLQPRKWENCYTLDRGTWGYRRNAKLEDYVTPHEMISALIKTVACGGNILINVGPTKEGIIVPIQQERLLQLGEWLAINGEAIYDTVPWTTQNDTLNTAVWYTSRPDEKKIYAITLDWPLDNTILLGSMDSNTISSVEVLGLSGVQDWFAIEPKGISITMPPFQPSLSKWAWSILIKTI